MKMLAVDYGFSRVGLAVCDEGGTLARPLKTISNHGHRRLARQISDISADLGVETIVVGLPLNLDGSRGKQASKVERFVEVMKEGTALPIVLHDERLSTETARERLDAAGRGGGSTDLDSAAAAVILQDFLDSQEDE